MTVLPELELALVTAAGRHRRPRLRAAALMTAAAVMAVLVFGFAFAGLSGSPQPEAEPENTSPASPPTGLPGLVGGTVVAPRTPAERRERLARTYSVFTRPRTAADRIPGGPVGPRRSRLVQDVRADLSQSRRVAVLEGIRTYIAPGTVRGRLAVCELTILRSRAGGGGCGPFDTATAASRPHWSRTTVRPGSVYTAILPDSVDEVTLVLRSGERITTPV